MSCEWILSDSKFVMLDAGWVCAFRAECKCLVVSVGWGESLLSGVGL